jgi:hypothetical protein
MCISDCWSSFGNITFYHRNGVCYFRSKPYSEFAGTDEQMENLDLHRRAIRAWQSLSHNNQMIWRFLAKDVIAHRPPFDNTSHISGYNLFVSAYHGFAQLGNEHIPEPKQFEPFPIFSLDFVGSESLENNDLLLSFRLTMCGTQDYSRYRVLGKIQLAAPGTGRNPGLMRNYLSPSVPENASSEILFTIPKLAGIEAMYQLHMRYLLIDNMTGYRSQYHTISTLMSNQLESDFVSF